MPLTRSTRGTPLVMMRVAVVFVFMLCASLWAGPTVSWAEGSDLQIGVLSDTHVHLEPGDDPAKDGSVARFRRALEYFRERKVDGVLVCGDLTDQGLDIELKAVADTWFAVFPDGRLPDGSPVANLMHYGDHDAETRFWNPRKERHLEACARLGVTPVRSLSVDENRKTCWEAFFHEVWLPIQVKRVKGRVFVLAHFMRETAGWNEGLAETLASAGVASDEPFFFSQHRPFKGTAFAKWGPDSGRNEQALQQYPNAVAFFGHTHYTLTDDRTVLQRGYTAINAGALKNQAVDRHHENGLLIPWIKEDVNRDLDMPCVPEETSQGGMIMRVSGDRIVLERRDFVTGLSLGPDLSFAVDVSARRRGDDRASEEKPKGLAPLFPKGAAVRLSRTSAVSRRKRTFEALRLEFPIAKSVGGHPRAHDYRVCAWTEDGRLVKERFVFSPAANRPESCDKGPVVCLFDVRDLDGAVRFTVEARSCWGRLGAPLSAGLAEKAR